MYIKKSMAKQGSLRLSHLTFPEYLNANILTSYIIKYDYINDRA